MKPVFVLGDICMDLVLPYGAAKRLKRGEAVTHAETDVVLRHGGSGANTAAGLCRLGIPVVFCGTVGADAYGEAMIAELKRLGADVRPMRKDRSVPTLLIAIVVDETGERTALATHRTGASQHKILSEQLPEDFPASIDWMHASGVLLREEPAASTVLDAMRRCHDAGVPVSLDIMARVESRNDAVFMTNLKKAASYCTVLLGSVRDELPLLAGDSSPESIAALTQGGRIVAARDGENGATVYTEQNAYFCPAFSVPVADTIGAGDAYNAGFIAGLLCGKPPSEANRMANGVAACCVMHIGGRCTPDADELESFLNTHA